MLPFIDLICQITRNMLLLLVWLNCVLAKIFKCFHFLTPLLSGDKRISVVAFTSKHNNNDKCEGLNVFSLFDDFFALFFKMITVCINCILPSDIFTVWLS